jgi:hypothetical protein
VTVPEEMVIGPAEKPFSEPKNVIDSEMTFEFVRMMCASPKEGPPPSAAATIPDDLATFDPTVPLIINSL